MVQGDGFPKVLIDQTGRRVVLAHKPERIVSVTLATDEILLALVERSRLLAVTYLAVDERISNVPREAAAVPHKIRADAEQIIALQPDLVFVASYVRGEVIKLLQDAGLTVFQFQEYDSVAAIQQNIRLVGQVGGEEARAEALIMEMNTRLQAVTARLVHAKARPRVLYWGAHGYTGGDHTSLQDLIILAGGENLAATHGIVGFATLSREQVLAMNPEVIFTAGDSRETQCGLPEFRLHPALQTVDALRNERPRSAEEGIGIVAVIHDLSMAIRCFRRLVLIHEGTVVGDGPPVDVLSVETISRIFRVQARLYQDQASGTPLLWFPVDKKRLAPRTLME